jgi:hypothetical protein
VIGPLLEALAEFELFFVLLRFTNLKIKSKVGGLLKKKSEIILTHCATFLNAVVVAKKIYQILLQKTHFMLEFSRGYPWTKNQE